MSLAAIELNDAAVALARDGELLSESPGFALMEKGTLLVGEDARRRSRLEPRSVSTRFWSRLSNDPVSPATPAGMTFADLAREHVSRVWASAGEGVDGVILYARLTADIGKLCSGRPFALQLSHGAARLPGLAAALQSAADGPAVTLPAGAGALGALERAAGVADADWQNTLTLSLPRDAIAAHGTVETTR